MKYVFVGDIHGKVHAVEHALMHDGKKIFVGDFIDSFDHSVEDHKKCYDLVLEAIAKGEAEAIFGNHELSYMMPIHRCSGYDSQRAMLMAHYRPQIEAAFKPYLFLADDFLVSHAGLTKQIWERKVLTLDKLKATLAKWWPNHNSAMHWIGHVRGGREQVGGLFWCDYRSEFKPVPELRQVFGHTRGMGIRTNDHRNWCIDALDWDKEKPQFLELDL